MVTITTTQGKSLTLTHDHLVKGSTDGEQTWRYLFSEKLQSGMLVMITQEDGTSEIDTVKTVSRYTMDGLWNKNELSTLCMLKWDDIALHPGNLALSYR